MASVTGTLSTAGTASGVFFLRAGETANVILTVTGTATVSLQGAPGQPAQAYSTLQSFTATTAGTEWRNTTGAPIYLRLYAVSLGGGSSVAYTLADVSGDQILAERPEGGWYNAAGALVAQVTDEGISGLFADQVSLNGSVNVQDPVYGAAGDGVTDDSDAIVAAGVAAGAGGEVVFPAGTYMADNLAFALAGQKFRALGRVIIKKRANGVLFQHSGDNVVIDGIEFDGAGATYTGHNVVLTGGRNVFRASSYDAEGRALKMTGARAIVHADNNIIATADNTASGYDIELGVSGTATLYHQVFGYVSTQAWGGILLTDTGSHNIFGGQFYKYTVAAGTSPAGVNGGDLRGSRVLGPVAIDVSNAVFCPHALGASATVTLGAATSGCTVYATTTAGAAWVNSGNSNNVMILQTSAGSSTKFRVGPDASAAYIEFVQTGNGMVKVPELTIPNNLNIYGRNAAADANAFSLGASTGNNLTLSALIENLVASVTTGKGFYRVINGTTVGLFDATGDTLGTAHGGAASLTRFKKATTGITDATLTTVATITIPNAAHSATIRFTVVGSLGAGGAIGANEASASNSYLVTIARTAGVNAVGAISSAFGAAASAVAGAATVTATLALAAVSGAVGATNTIPVQVTITRSGGSSTNHTALVSWEILNANATGVTVA